MSFLTRFMHWYRHHQHEERREQQTRAQTRVAEETQFVRRMSESLEKVCDENRFNIPALEYKREKESFEDPSIFEGMRARIRENHTEITHNKEEYIRLLGLHTFNTYCIAYHQCMQALERYDEQRREISDSGES